MIFKIDANNLDNLLILLGKIQELHSLVNINKKDIVIITSFYVYTKIRDYLKENKPNEINEYDYSWHFTFNEFNFYYSSDNSGHNDYITIGYKLDDSLFEPLIK